jgi:Domain of unknown function (DUF4340)
MSKRFDNKRLVYIMAGLLLLLLLTLVVKIPKQAATLKSSLFSIDTSKVAKVILYPRGKNQKPVEFRRVKDSWTVQQEKIVSAVERGAAQNMLTEAVNIKPQSLAGNNEAIWDEFNLSDTSAIRVKFMGKGDRVLADILIGKFTYKQVNDPSMYGGNNVRGTSYVRLKGEKEVYAVDGFLSLSFSGSFNDWRDKTFIVSNPNDITGFKFVYGADSSFTLAHDGSAWKIDGLAADSAKTADFLTNMAFLRGSNIRDNYVPENNPDFQLIATADNLSAFTVKCWKSAGKDEYFLNSSRNPDVYFKSSADGLFYSVFKNRKYFTTAAAQSVKHKK